VGDVGMNNNQVDISAVSYLNLALVKCKLLMPYIDSNDKTPVWDGEIQLFGNERHTRDWVRKIPVQVKGTTIGDLTDNQITHPVKMSNLENYSKNGGVMYFVVMIKGDKNRIYYRRLLPQDIQPIIKEMAGSSRYTAQDPEKAITLSVFPNDEYEIIKLMNHFLANITINRPIYSFPELNEYRDFTVTHSGIGANEIDPRNISDLAKYLNDTNTYRYVVPKGFPNERLPIERDDNVCIFLGEDLPSLVKGVNISRVATGDGMKIYFGANPDVFNRSIVLNFDTNEINVTISGTLQQQLTDIDFVLKDDLFLTLPSRDRTRFTELYDFLLRIKTAWERCGMNADIDYSGLSANERNQLLNLVSLLSDEFDDSEPQGGILKQFRIFNVLDKKILLHKKHSSSGKFMWANPYEIFPKSWVTESNENGEPCVESAVVISTYLLCNKIVFAQYSNTDYDKVYQALIESEMPKFVIEQCVLKTQCSLISAYDVDSENKAVLDVAILFGDWLSENTSTDKDCLFLNKLQILKRREGCLPPTAYEEIVKLSKSNNCSIQFAAYTLLDNPSKACEFLQQLEENEKDALMSTPIYYLYKLADEVDQK